VAGIPPENMFNYDETNLRDNPGAQKAIFRRGCKFAEQVGEHTKDLHLGHVLRLYKRPVAAALRGL
jgi:hypothetical protein